MGSALLLGFLVLVIFCKKERGLPLETRTEDRCFFSLELSEGLADSLGETLGALVEALDNAAFY